MGDRNPIQTTHHILRIVLKVETQTVAMAMTAKITAAQIMTARITTAQTLSVQSMIVQSLTAQIMSEPKMRRLETLKSLPETNGKTTPGFR